MIYNPGAMPFQQKIETGRVVLRNLQHQGRVAIQGILRHHDQLNVFEGEAVTGSVVRNGKKPSPAFDVPETQRTRWEEETDRITRSAASADAGWATAAGRSPHRYRSRCRAG